MSKFEEKDWKIIQMNISINDNKNIENNHNKTEL